MPSAELNAGVAFAWLTGVEQRLWQNNEQAARALGIYGVIAKCNLNELKAALAECSKENEQPSGQVRVAVEV